MGNVLKNIVVLDTETSLHNNQVGDFKASPFSPNNWVVHFGAVHLDPKTMDVFSPYDVSTADSPHQFSIPAPTEEQRPETLLVGHNIGFDLLHLANTTNTHSEHWREFLLHPESMIWDTQLAEYRLGGQRSISISLDALSEKHGLPLKPGGVKEYWEAGVSTEDIALDVILPYLKHDVETTAAIFKLQIIEAQRQGILPLLRAEMNARLSTLSMELCGMHFDKDWAEEQLDTWLVPSLQNITEQVHSTGLELSIPLSVINPGSPKFLSTVLYGGDFKIRQAKPILTPEGKFTYYKSGLKKGKKKSKLVDVLIPYAMQSPVKLDSTDAAALDTVINHVQCPPKLRVFLKNVLKYRELTKLGSTYLTGYSKLTWPDGMIHGSINHTITATGRLSSSQPNLQNAGHSIIRKGFKSRYRDGKLLEVDKSQIEIVIQAFLSQDRNMIDDIKNKVDFHTKRAAFAHGTKYEDALRHVYAGDSTWLARRKAAKTVSFQKAYGAQAKAIAKSTGLPLSAVVAFMDAEDRSYPQVPVTQARWIQEVNSSTATMNGEAFGVLRSALRGSYVFRPDLYHGRYSYKPTTIKNYPIQGMAADLMKIVLGELRRALHIFNAHPATCGDESVLMVNTVHDSVVFDVPQDVHANPNNMQELHSLLMHTFTDRVIYVLKNSFGIDFNVPIRADAKIGDDWFTMKELKI